VLDPLVGVLDIAVERLSVEDRGRGVLVFVRPATDLDHRLHVGHDQLGMLVGHDIGAGDHGGGVGHLQGPVRILGQVLDRLELAGVLLQVLEDFALGVDRIDDPLFQSPFPSGRNARSCLWSRRSQSSDGLFISTWSISGLSYQSSG
jgi:hypothetical protein